ISLLLNISPKGLAGFGLGLAWARLVRGWGIFVTSLAFAIAFAWVACSLVFNVAVRSSCCGALGFIFVNFLVAVAASCPGVAGFLDLSEIKAAGDEVCQQQDSNENVFHSSRFSGRFFKKGDRAGDYSSRTLYTLWRKVCDRACGRAITKWALNC